jgi:hypothetical protein
MVMADFATLPVIGTGFTDGGTPTPNLNNVLRAFKRSLRQSAFKNTDAKFGLIPATTASLWPLFLRSERKIAPGTPAAA